MSQFVLFSILVVTAVVLYKLIVYPIWISPLGRIPNAHWSSAMSPAWILWQRKDATENHALLDCHRRLGAIVRTGPGEVSISGFEDVRTVYSGNFEKETWLARSMDNYSVPNMFSMESKKAHADRKRMLWSAYAHSHVLSSETLKNIAQRLVCTRLQPQLEQLVRERRPCNVVDLCCAWVMDFTTAHLFGIERGTDFLLQKASREAFFADYGRRTAHAFWPAQFPTLAGCVNGATFGRAQRAAEAANRRIEGWCAERCDTAAVSYTGSEQTREKPANVYAHLRSHLEPASQSLDADAEKQRADTSVRTAIASEMLDHCAAPQETAGTALASCLRQLSAHSAAQRALRREIRATFPSLDARAPTPAELESCAYLHAVVLEALRLHDHTPGPPRFAPPGGCTLNGYETPAGTRVSALAYVLHRDVGAFRDPEAFRPERWTEAGAEERERMQRHFWAFGSGDRQCVARHFAMIVMKAFLTGVYSRCTTALVREGDREQGGREYLPGPMGKPLHLRFDETVDGEV